MGEGAITLAETILALKKTLPRYAVEYREGLGRRAALVAYGDPAALLAALDEASALDPGAKGILVANVVWEHRERRAPVWQTLLLVAFERSLRRVRWRLYRQENADLDQRVLLVFLETLHLPLVTNHEAYAGKALADEVKHSLFRSAQKKRERKIETELFDEPEADPVPIFQQRARETLDALLSDLEDDDRDMLLHTLGRGELITDYVAARYPAARKKERQRLVVALREKRANIVRELRKKRRMQDGELAPQDFEAE